MSLNWGKNGVGISKRRGSRPLQGATRGCLLLMTVQERASNPAFLGPGGQTHLKPRALRMTCRGRLVESQCSMLHRGHLAQGIPCSILFLPNLASPGTPFYKGYASAWPVGSSCAFWFFHHISLWAGRPPPGQQRCLRQGVGGQIYVYHLAGPVPSPVALFRCSGRCCPITSAEVRFYYQYYQLWGIVKGSVVTGSRNVLG